MMFTSLSSECLFCLKSCSHKKVSSCFSNICERISLRCSLHEKRLVYLKLLIFFCYFFVALHVRKKRNKQMQTNSATIYNSIFFRMHSNDASGDERV